MASNPDRTHTHIRLPFRRRDGRARTGAQLRVPGALDGRGAGGGGNVRLRGVRDAFGGREANVRPRGIHVGDGEVGIGIVLVSIIKVSSEWEGLDFRVHG